MRKFLRLAALAAAVLAGTTPARALTTTITFNDGIDSTFATSLPFLFHNDQIAQNGYYVGTVSTKSGAQPIDGVGALLDGSDPNSCFGVLCPQGNSTQYLAMLNDGLPFVGRLNNEAFQIKSFDAGFIAAEEVTVPSTSLVLFIDGYDDFGFVASERIDLPGPVGGVYNFDTYSFSDAFANLWLTQVQFWGYACTPAGTCNRSSNRAQFGLDNLVFEQIPEPGSLALAGLAFGGLVTLRRRRQAFVG